MNGSNHPRRRSLARPARGRHAARPRLSRLLALLSTATLVAGGAMVALAGPASAGGGSGTTKVHVKQSTIDDHDNGCEASDWSGVHFVMTQLGTGYPASITVTLTDGSTDTTVTADRWKTTGKTTHYNYWFTSTTENLRVKDATAVVPAGWSGQFNISHCWPGDDSPGDSTPPVTTITLSKLWVNGTEGDSVNLTISGDVLGATDGSWPVADGTNGNPATATAEAGASVTISETAAAGTDLTDYTSAWQCTVDNKLLVIDDHDVKGDGTSGSFTLPDDIANLPTIDCTFTNTHKTTITVEKQWVVNGGDPVADTADDGMTPGTLTVTGVQDVTWGVPFEWTDDEWPAVTERIDDVSVPYFCSVVEQQPLHVDHPDELVAHQNNVITVTNHVKCEGQITLYKIWEGASGSPSTTLTINGGTADGATATSTWNSDLGSNPDWGHGADFTGLAGDSVTISETPVPGYSATWACYDQVPSLRSASVGAFVTAVPDNYGDPVKQGSGTSAEFSMPVGYLDCYFTNTKTTTPPPPPPTATAVTPAYTYQCVLVDDQSQVTVTPTDKPGLSYDVTGNGTDTVTVLATAASGNYTVTVPVGWTDAPDDAASIVLHANDLNCIGGVVDTGTPPSTGVEAVTPPTIEVLGESKELPPPPAVMPAAQAAPSANAHTGQGESPWGYLLLGAGLLLLIGATRVRRYGRG